jgi:hypothetical protein
VGLIRPTEDTGLARPWLMRTGLISLVSTIAATGKVGIRSGDELAVEISLFAVVGVPVSTKESALATLTLSLYLKDPCFLRRRRQRTATRQTNRTKMTPKTVPRIIASVSVLFSWTNGPPDGMVVLSASPVLIVDVTVSRKSPVGVSVGVGSAEGIETALGVSVWICCSTSVKL